MSDSRFDDLVGRMLDHELTTEEWAELIGMIRDNPALQDELRAQLEVADLLGQLEDDLRHSSRFLEATRSRLGDDAFVSAVQSAIRNGAGSGLAPPAEPKPRRGWSTRLPWALALAASIIALVATVASLPLRGEPEIARITELNGSLLWIGDGGRVVRDLVVGASLSGGTLETMTADSWVALRFRDGSSVTVSGPSMLTISEHARKELHLLKGNVFARVTPQTRGNPMLIHTRTAELEVLGTRLNVEAEASATRLRVNEGRVRLTRLVDGKVAEVPANYQVVAKADRLEALTPTRREQAVNHWKSQLSASMGQWLPPSDGLEARLRALPIVFNRPKEGPLALYVAAFGASQCELPPVLLERGSRFRIQGRLASAQELHFGVTTRKREGGFGGKFELTIPATKFEAAGGPFDVTINLGDLRPQHPRVAGSPIESELEDCFLFNVNTEAGLEVMEVELLPPASPRLDQPAEGEGETGKPVPDHSPSTTNKPARAA